MTAGGMKTDVLFISTVDPTMLPMVKPLTDEDIENLAEYYSTLK